MSGGETMRGGVAPEPGGPEALRIETRPRPVPGPGEILVRIEAAGVNRPDLMQRQGHYPPPKGASDILGLEFSGTVEGAGEGASRFAPGSRVMALVAGGGYAEYATVHESNALPVPDGVSAAEAAAFPETAFTVWSNVFERARLQAGETLLVHGGTSGIGTTAIRFAVARGARAIATAGSPEKCAACLRLGADAAIDYRREDFVEAGRRLTDGRGPDVILDMVGGDYVARNIQLVATDGRIAQIAFQKGAKIPELDLMPLLLKRLTLTGSTLRARPVAMKAELAGALEREILPHLARGELKPVIDRVFPFGEMAEAHRYLEAGDHIGKVVLQMR